MRLLYLLFGVLFITLALPQNAEAKRPPKDVEQTQIVFDKMSHDFGTILRERRKYNCVFTAENVGQEPLVILNVSTSCSCLKAHYLRRPIMPGESVYIRVTIEAEKMQEGVFHRVVEVSSNAGKSLLSVKGTTVKKR